MFLQVHSPKIAADLKGFAAKPKRADPYYVGNRKIQRDLLTQVNARPGAQKRLLTRLALYCVVILLLALHTRASGISTLLML